MRLGLYILLATLAAGSSLLALPPAALAQTPVSALTAVAELPDAPQAQTEVAAIEPLAQQKPAQQPGARGKGGAPAAVSDPQLASISGTVVDVNGDLIPEAKAVLDGPALTDRRTIVVDVNGFFQFSGLTPGTAYHVTVSAKGFVTWNSATVTLTPGQFLFLTDCKLQVEGNVTSVTVYSSPDEIAVEQVKVEEQQRILGIIPNFYVVYDPNPAPLTAKLKFKLAFRVSVDPISYIGAAFLGAIDQAADTPNYVQGWKGYGQRVGAVYAGGVTDIMFGGAILPTILHQDPRYFYQGTGTKKSRLMHALANPFLCKGDNGRREINYSSIGGDIASAAISNAYYPESNRGAELVLQNVLIDTGERMVSSILQEFVLRKLTPKAKKQE
ncbi:MAG: carboxypeptidase-like regulatory domain-containing protein [Terracidiphilus sp.]|jgi:hypothetical protein